MKTVFIILALIVCAVVADNYRCPNPGDAFECFESDATARFCVSGKRGAYVICSKCRRKYEFCANGAKVSKRPEVECRPDWASTECTSDNSDVPSVM
ncbi:schistosomin-like [Biomphalaria glabrata]|uniref:Schistosomin-like n=3 Tax=Biomphalaria TaxID=6525 RepID=A0A9W3AQB7_BIOGL|nr:schistosomin-like [Biomphalaria glabrata]XP_055889457.1 schistosomin-like [Biomphalaria glabrata]